MGTPWAKPRRIGMIWAGVRWVPPGGVPAKALKTRRQAGAAVVEQRGAVAAVDAGMDVGPATGAH